MGGQRWRTQSSDDASQASQPYDDDDGYDDGGVTAPRKRAPEDLVRESGLKDAYAFLLTRGALPGLEKERIDRLMHACDAELSAPYRIL